MKQLSIIFITLFVVACSATPYGVKSEGVVKIKEITPTLIETEKQAKEACTDQVAYMIEVDHRKHNGVEEQDVLNAIDKHRRIVLDAGNQYPAWLHVRYQQITRDIYRRDRDLYVYGRQVFEECMYGELYITEENN